ncbi:MAG: NAD(P)H-dependent glycerol-3-phosphate dehydrogenase [Actinobacteria bacterium]|nr:MAG: NAD(P)H-dependent glycerol-3-phosphate dehydrogenase [Actinomycetota bacterium]
MVARSAATTIWARSPEVACEINESHTNRRYLGDVQLHTSLQATASVQEATDNADVVIMGVPSHAFRQVLQDAAPHLRPWMPVVSLVKGLEQGTDLRMSQIVAEVLPGFPAGILAGPNIAREVANGYAAAATIAMPDQSSSGQLAELFRTSRFRVYSTTDVIGVEIAGALKNVYAIAAGMSDGVGAGLNTKAMVMTRALRELTRLGEALGGQRDTFAGLTGMGDLAVTCMSPLSRNRHVGEELGRGQTIEDVLAGMTQVAEGVKAAPVAVKLAAEAGVDVPIAQEVHAVLRGEATVLDAYRGLTRRAPGHEIHGVGW